jgi:hypothetical protein
LAPTIIIIIIVIVVGHLGLFAFVLSIARPTFCCIFHFATQLNCRSYSLIERDERKHQGHEVGGEERDL